MALYSYSAKISKMLGILWKSVRTACYLAFVQNYALETQKREVLYVLLLDENNELTGHMAVNYKYFLELLIPRGGHN